MIQKVNKIQDVGMFKSINQSVDFIYGGKGANCNILFGFNGMGKTTLSNIFSFFGESTFISEDEKKELFDDLKSNNTATAELLLQGKSTIKYPSSSPHNKSIYIFNSNFVTSHVFNGSESRLKKFSTVSGEIKNKEIDKINQSISDLNDELTTLGTETKALESKHVEITKSNSKDFGKALTDKNKSISSQNLDQAVLPGEKLEALQENLRGLINDYELSKKQSELNSDLEELRIMNFSAVNFDFSVAEDLLTTTIQQLSKEALETKIKEIRALFDDEPHQQAVERWFKFGKEVLDKLDTKEANCPICGTDISHKLTSILDNYNNYFDESYEGFMRDLEIKLSEVTTIGQTIDEYEKQIASLERFSAKYVDYLNDLEAVSFDFSKSKKAFNEIKGVLANKNKNIQATNLSTPADFEETLKELNKNLPLLEQNKVDILSTLEAKKLSTNNIEGLMRAEYKKIILLEFNNSLQGDSLAIYKTNTTRIKTINETKLVEQKGLLSTELAKIKAESRSITKYLHKMGIDSFDIDINDNKETDNIVVRYKNTTNERDRLKNCLSDGEKTALAFAYFLSKYENEISTSKRADSVVIIDDPISSLDDNRLYSTAHLISSNFDDAKQLIVLSHNFLFLKYFNSFYRGKANCLFLSRGKISELPEELKNFETPYFYMLRNIIEFLDSDNRIVSYDEVRKYLPNFIRRVLETFLSFKFSRTVDNRASYRSPGLADFTNSIDATDFKDSVKSELKEKVNEISRVSDGYSHGNVHHTQENYYISEDDLRLLAINTLYIMDTMDSLHSASFKDKLRKEKVEV
jgi:wobble nucleotide-excising tRNase